ncbi:MULTISPECIES: helix-turn-helix domain-containing protein [Flavobacteriaceae]|uniref:helix-turn-helix domain-containing protein n=1 Tax=Flavobacteriaceae TaxID=49546 RepID=UPI001491A494|nr:MULTISPECIES: helix-turn-helix domain-containing protein [Allomuricauda]MDC6367365.1 helix-turn-helix domain-containing protein [Muricauda sp. AC10]
MRASSFLVFLFLVIGANCYSKTSRILFEPPFDGAIFQEQQDSLQWADYYYNIHLFEKAISLYQKNLENPDADKPHLLKKIALGEAGLGNASKSIENIHEYLQLEYNPNFLLNEDFDSIRKTEEFKGATARLIPKVTTWSIIFLFVALVGFYVVFLISINKQIHPSSRFLIAFFIFIHSIFMLNISISRANYTLEYPHTYLMSTWASFLYGPLLFFYFKKISKKYQYKKIDLLHLIPTVLLTAYLIVDVYSLSFDEKRYYMLSRIQHGLNPQDSDKLILLVVLKIVSLTVYGYFIRRVYVKGKREKLLDAKNYIWQKHIYLIHASYVITYTIYGITIMNGVATGILFDTTAITMAAMVLYVGYSANIQPQIFNGAYTYTNGLFSKYQKSGLTPSLSIELKENLLYLFGTEKIYKENNINLDMVANRLNTTRHNASQIINEHFNVSFHEFVNTYRIKEAKELLLAQKSQRLNIINIAYEVGYNNKVTFNKAFKKDTQLTPSQYQRSTVNH